MGQAADDGLLLRLLEESLRSRDRAGHGEDSAIVALGIERCDKEAESSRIGYGHIAHEKLAVVKLQADLPRAWWPRLVQISRLVIPRVALEGANEEEGLQILQPDLDRFVG